MRALIFSALVGLAFLWACGSTNRWDTPSRHYDRDKIDTAEIRQTNADTALDLIEMLRPHWLRGRGAKSIKFGEVSYPYVYVNGNRIGSIDALATLPADNITSMKFLDAGDATILLGMNHPSGAIVIQIF